MDKKQNNGAAWRKSINTKYGQVEVISATIDGKRYTLWPNKSKKEAKHPDYNVQEDTYVPNRELSQAGKAYQAGKSFMEKVDFVKPPEDLPF